MLKKFNEFVEEGVFRSTVMHSTGKVIKDEDKFVPDYIDFGENTTVLWCVENYSVGEKNKFTWDEIHDLNLTGWRLPTVKEVEELEWFGWHFEKNIAKIDFKNNHKNLNFNGETINKYGGYGFKMWTSEEYNDRKGYYYGFVRPEDFKIDLYGKLAEYYVYLVKDKK